MTPCPVCETPNPPGASECATCGKVFAVAVVGDVAAGGLAELESGRVDARTIRVAPEVMADLDAGRSAPVAAVPDDRTPDLEMGRAASVNVAVEQAPDMEQTAVAEKEWTPLSDGPVTCRACGTPQADPSTIFCGNCGRRLPVVAAREGVLIDATPVPSSQDERVRCFACGGRVVPAELCSDCGLPLRAQSA